MTTHRDRPVAAGFALLSAIFLLVGVAALGAFAVTVGTAQHSGSVLDLIGVRAYYAARAGVEWGSARTTDPAFCLANPSTNVGRFDAIDVTVECLTLASGDTAEAGLGSIYTIAATACTHPIGAACPGSVTAPGYVERRVTVLVER